jgi:hypothetical protein
MISVTRFCYLFQYRVQQFGIFNCNINQENTSYLAIISVNMVLRTDAACASISRWSFSLTFEASQLACLMEASEG